MQQQHTEFVRLQRRTKTQPPSIGAEQSTDKPSNDLSRGLVVVQLARRLSQTLDEHACNDDEHRMNVPGADLHEQKHPTNQLTHSSESGKADGLHVHQG